MMSFESQVLSELKRCGIGWLAWLPDSETKSMYDLMTSDPDLRLVPVCHESEAVGVCSGLLRGGQSAAVLIQNTGLMNAVDAIRGMALYFHEPMLLILGYRGYKGMVEEAPTIDSAAVYTEPLLKALGIPYLLVEGSDDVGRIGQAYDEAQRTSGPAAVLMIRGDE